MAVLTCIQAILADDHLDAESSEESKCEHIERLITIVGWEAVRAGKTGQQGKRDRWIFLTGGTRETGQVRLS